MPRIKEKFAELEAKNQKALISYIMVGFSNEKATIATVRGLIKGGVDIIELGFPFSDPLADGPVIQNASTISLEKGTKIAKFFSLVKKIRKETDIPLILMTYTNILYHQGYAKFIADAKKAGIDGFILPDMSVEESKDYLQAAKKQGRCNISNLTKHEQCKDSENIKGIIRIFVSCCSVWNHRSKNGNKKIHIRCNKTSQETNQRENSNRNRIRSLNARGCQNIHQGRS